nr:hypothetical protein CFP56_21248 [Quercus suber]
MLSTCPSSIIPCSAMPYQSPRMPPRDSALLFGGTDPYNYSGAILIFEEVFVAYCSSPAVVVVSVRLQINDILAIFEDSA